MHTPRFISNERLQLLFFGGKGGVGKTTCATATALHLSVNRPQSSILLFSTDPAHSLDDTHVSDASLSNLQVREINAPALLEEFKDEHDKSLKEIAMRGTFLDEEDIDTFLHLSLPGLDELMSFLHIAEEVERGEHDVIIVDTAPTGHTLRLMGLPALSKRWLQALDALLAKSRYMRKIFKGTYQSDHLDSFLYNLSNSLDNLHAILLDQERFQFVPVMLAEELSVYETELLIHDLRDLDIQTQEIVINGVFFTESECQVCQERRRAHIHTLREISSAKPFTNSELWAVPQFAQEMNSPDSLQSFWQEAFPVQADIFQSPSFGRDEQVQENCVLRQLSLTPLHKELLVFAGKGGVGKTTLSAASALRLGRDDPEKKILLFSTDPAHSLSACFQQDIGNEPRAVTENVMVMEINAQAEFDALKNAYQQELASFLKNLSSNMDLTFDREVMERVMDLSPPGLDEVMALLVATEAMQRDRYDCLVLDSAPTGHLIRLLETPQIIDEWLKAFFNLFLKYKQVFRLPGISKKMVQMSKALKSFRAMLQDEDRAALIGISILTEMALEETKDLMAACHRLSVRVPLLVCNLATRDSSCTLCHQLFEREQVVRQKFEQAFPNVEQTLIYRCGHPEGTQNLLKLGQQLFHSPSGQTEPWSKPPADR